MGTDTPVAVLSQRPRMLYDYFQQLFAQVTNPPLDAIREEVVTSLQGTTGGERDLLNPDEDSCRQIVLQQPILRNDELAKLINVDPDHEVHGRPHGMRSTVIRCLYPVAEGGAGLAAALDDVRAQVSAAIGDGARIIVLSDRESDEQLAPIPSLLAVSAVHHHLVRDRTRTQVGLVVEAGDAREVHHMAMLIGFGAAAINPYMAFESIEDMVDRGVIDGIDRDKALNNYVKAAGKGVLKVMSKMGISTLASYTGAQLFQAIGISEEVLDEYFTGLSCPTGGITSTTSPPTSPPGTRWPTWTGPTSARTANSRSAANTSGAARASTTCSTRTPCSSCSTPPAPGSTQIFKEYTRLVDDQSERMASLRGLLKFRGDVRPPVPLDEVEPASEIVKRFSTGAMSYGSISAEAHETLAIAMNRLGGRSNCGEGGEDVKRFDRDDNGDWRRSAIKQVASARFGVTSHYLTNCTDIQIKMAQGAKPGEGGQLPGHKVYPWVAEVRHSTPGVGLISPPPHHDIYSIEDLAQLIHDLKNANPSARVHVKLVSENGVGTVAAGVSKAHADVVLISGHDGGTGATPLTSQKHAGAPWELGLAETQQTLLLNGLRDRIVVQVDGQLKTGRDVMIAALLGAEEFGFATAPLVVAGCIMMRVCHLDTCPVGVATQNPVLRERFNGKPEFVENFFMFIAEEVREYMAQLGFRTINEMVGQVGRAGHHAGARALEGPQAGPDAGAARAGVGVHEPGPVLQLASGPRPGQGARSAADRAEPRGPGLRHAGAVLHHDRQRQPHGRHHARPRADQSLWRPRPSGRHHRHHVRRFGGQQLRRLRAQGHHAAGVRRRQRLRRQGTVRWPDRGAAVGQRAAGLRRRGQHHRRQRDPVRRHQRGGLPARRGRRAVRGPQLRRPRGGRGRRRPRLRVHDRRQGRHPRPHRPQLRGGHVRRHGLRLRPGRRTAGQPQRRDGRARDARRRRRRTGCTA